MVPMDDQDGSTPQPPAEALLIRRHRMAAGLTSQAAAEATDGKVSYRRWAQIEQGFTIKAGKRVPTVASDQALAHMAAAVGVVPERLVEVGRAEAAEVLTVILEDRDVSAEGRQRSDQQIVRMMAEYFEDESVSPDEKRIMAERFFRVLPYYVAGQRPPRDILDDVPPNGGSRSA